MPTYMDVILHKDKSFDPSFQLSVSYTDGDISFKHVLVNAYRKPPRLKIEYPEEIQPLLDKIDLKVLELEIMKKIVEFIIGISGKAKNFR